MTAQTILDIEPARYSDEWLVWAKEYGCAGDRNSAGYLAKIPQEYRQRATGIAHTIMNLSGGNYSGSVYEAVRLLQNANFGETYPERTAREFREQENAKKAAMWESLAAVNAARAAQGLHAVGS